MGWCAVDCPRPLRGRGERTVPSVSPLTNYAWTRMSKPRKRRCDAILGVVAQRPRRPVLLGQECPSHKCVSTTAGMPSHHCSVGVPATSRAWTGMSKPRSGSAWTRMSKPRGVPADKPCLDRNVQATRRPHYQPRLDRNVQATARTVTSHTSYKYRSALTGITPLRANHFDTKQQLLRGHTMPNYASDAIELLIALRTPSPKGYRGVCATANRVKGVSGLSKHPLSSR